MFIIHYRIANIQTNLKLNWQLLCLKTKLKAYFKLWVENNQSNLLCCQLQNTNNFWKLCGKFSHSNINTLSNKKLLCVRKEEKLFSRTTKNHII